MTDSNVRSLPGNITLDLDAEERPPEEVKEEFAVLIKGRRIVMVDPAELDWRDLALMDSSIEFFRLSLSPEDRKYLMEQELPGWKMNKLMKSYELHFDLEEKVRASQRQQRLTGI